MEHFLFLLHPSQCGNGSRLDLERRCGIMLIEFVPNIITCFLLYISVVES